MAIIKNPDGTITVGIIREEPKPKQAEAPAEEKPKKKAVKKK